MIILKTLEPQIDAIDGYFILIEPGDTVIDLPELKRTIADMSWDGVWLKDGHYHAVYLTSNEFALEFIFPASIDGAIRENLEAHISPSYLKEQKT